MPRRVLPFRIHCAETADSLYELKDGRFQLVSNGRIAPLMLGFGYVLAEQALCEYLKSMKVERVQFCPAIIWRRSTDEEIHTHWKLKVNQSFTLEQISDIALEGNRLLMMQATYLFASPSLKTSLTEAGFSYLKFSEGLSEFAGDT